MQYRSVCEGTSRITAIVLIQASRGMITDLAQALLELPEVAEVYSVAGEYDLAETSG